MLKKFPSDKINGTKNALFFFRELQLITVLLLIFHPYISWSTRFVSLKLYVKFSIFASVSFLLKFTFLFNEMYGYFYSFTLKRRNSFQHENDSKVTHSFAPKLWFLSCNKKF